LASRAIHHEAAPDGAQCDASVRSASIGMGTHYVAVDPDAVKVKFDPSDKKWHANISATRDELKAAPEFKYEGQWNASKS
jgi:hypothetical protein